MQKDAKMVSYKVVDKASKPYVEVTIADEKKVQHLSLLTLLCPGARWRICMDTTVCPCMYAALSSMLAVSW